MNVSVVSDLNVGSQEADVLLSRLLYVDRAGDGDRYDSAFLAEQMEKFAFRLQRRT